MHTLSVQGSCTVDASAAEGLVQLDAPWATVVAIPPGLLRFEGRTPSPALLNGCDEVTLHLDVGQPIDGLRGPFQRLSLNHSVARRNQHTVRLPRARHLSVVGLSVAHVPECDTLHMRHARLRCDLPDVRVVTLLLTASDEPVTLGGPRLERLTVTWAGPPWEVVLRPSPRLHTTAGAFTPDLEGTTAVDALWRLMRSDDPEHRLQALELLELTPEAVPALAARVHPSQERRRMVEPNLDMAMALAARHPVDIGPKLRVWSTLEDPNGLAAFQGLRQLTFHAAVGPLDLSRFPQLTHLRHVPGFANAPPLQMAEGTVAPEDLVHIAGARVLKVRFTRPPSTNELEVLGDRYHELSLQFPQTTAIERLPRADRLRLVNAVITAEDLPWGELDLVGCQVAGPSRLVLSDRRSLKWSGGLGPRQLVLRGPCWQWVEIRNVWGLEEVVLDLQGGTVKTHRIQGVPVRSV